MGAPQIILIVLISIHLLLTLIFHGRLKAGWDRKFNVWVALWNRGLLLTLLIWGGFFSQ